MPEAVIVATTRSPIGRAFKGNLVDFRPDDLAATIIQAALDKVPALDPHTIDDLILGCGLPGGEQGYNMGRVVAVQLGLDDVPGTTITRYCSSSLQTTRMAFHAIKAGEGDAFISAGVEMVSRFAKGNSDSLPDTQNPEFATAQAVSRETGVTLKYQVGTMIELPRACLKAGEIAQAAEFFSFGTNDLTQTTFGFSRDDSDKFLKVYIDQKILPGDPFESIDQTGVGQLMEIAVEKARFSTGASRQARSCSNRTA